MRIQDLEKRTGFERPTIRFYEREGLLFPKRLENGYRDYSEENVQQLLKIKLLRQLGMSVEQISQIQKGSADFSDALDRQVKILTDRIDDNIQARFVCETMRRNQVQYNTLDAEHYLSLLMNVNTKEPMIKKDFQEDIPKPIHPWRRYIARALDYLLLRVITNFVVIVLFRVRPLPGTWINVLLEMARLAAFIPMEAVMLHYFGTTPGKFAMGIRIDWIQGGRLPMRAAMDRAASVWMNGVAFGVPIIGLFFQLVNYCRLTGRALLPHQKYNNINPPSDMEWDNQSELIYTNRKGRQSVTLICILLLCLGLLTVNVADSVKPKYRGDEITIQQFAENYNDTMELLYKNVEDYEKLNYDGSWITSPSSVATIEIGAKSQYAQPALIYETNNGIVHSITYENSWTEVFYLQPMNTTCWNIANSVLLAQDGISYQDIIEFANLMEQCISNEADSIRYDNIEVQWDVRYENCRYVNGTVIGENSEDINSAANGTASVVFKIIIHTQE